jgi:hypothetical protein
MKNFVNIIIQVEQHIIPMVLPIGNDPLATNAFIRRYVRNITRAIMSLDMRASAIVHVSYPNGTHENLHVHENRTEKF